MKGSGVTSSSEYTPHLHIVLDLESMTNRTHCIQRQISCAENFILEFGVSKTWVMTDEWRWEVPTVASVAYCCNSTFFFLRFFFSYSYVFGHCVCVENHVESVYLCELNISAEMMALARYVCMWHRSYLVAAVVCPSPSSEQVLNGFRMCNSRIGYHLSRRTIRFVFGEAIWCECRLIWFTW